MYRDAAQLHKHATTNGNPRAASELISRFHALLHPTDPRPAHHAAAHVSLDDPYVAWLLDVLRDPGAQEQTAAWLARHPAVHVTLDDPRAVAELLNAMWWAGAQEQAVALAELAVVRVSLDAPPDAARLLDAMWWAGAQEHALALAERAAVSVSPRLLARSGPAAGRDAGGRGAGTGARPSGADRRTRPPRQPARCAEAAGRDAEGHGAGAGGRPRRTASCRRVLRCVPQHERSAEAVQVWAGTRWECRCPLDMG